MENKYYTPKIEEFHYGFEYEFLIPNITYYNLGTPEYRAETVYKWHKRTWNQYETRLCKLDRGSYLCNFRVKYLDKEDIESLGFDNSLDEPDEWYWSYKGNEEIQLYFNDKPEVINNDQSLGMPVSIYKVDLVFSGYIKNKSELIKLMKQLGIWQE